MTDFIYDTEEFPNCFIFGAELADGSMTWQYEISDRVNESAEIVAFCEYLAASKSRGVGFNNLGWDYPILHMLLKMRRSDAATLYQKAQAIIGSQDENRWLHMVKPTDRLFTQVDLFSIHHFSNRARSTSLKVLQFNMRQESIQDLPFPPGTVLTPEQIVTLRQYNRHDLATTRAFYHESMEQIRFREQLSEKYDRDFLNHDDTKIGKDFFVMELERAGIPCYDYTPDKGRMPRQTRRPVVALKDAILPSIQFQTPDLQRVLTWLKEQTITETKGVFKDLTAKVGVFELTFGLGGIHGSIENARVESNADYAIVDLDVSSYYPNLAIKNRFRPAHYPDKFCDIYASLYEQRKQYAKNTAENAMLKLALNGSFGAGNDQYSVFYDPLFLLQITLAGQLQLAMLVEWLTLGVPGLNIIQCNTDGVTVHVPRVSEPRLNELVQYWEQYTGMTMETMRFNRLHIADVNNYIGQYEDGKVKRKGKYEHDLEWHQNFSALVVPKVAEQVLLHDAPIRQTVEQWSDKMDFMLRIKVPRTGYLTWRTPGSDVEHQIQNCSRYMVAKGGVQLGKWLPPLPNGNQWRRSSVEAGWLVCVCNELRDAEGVVPDFDYYVQEVEKLTLSVM